MYSTPSESAGMVSHVASPISQKTLKIPRVSCVQCLWRSDLVRTRIVHSLMIRKNIALFRGLLKEAYASSGLINSVMLGTSVVTRMAWKNYHLLSYLCSYRNHLQQPIHLLQPKRTAKYLLPKGLCQSIKVSRRAQSISS